jgi:hypothetical protein
MDAVFQPLVNYERASARWSDAPTLTDYQNAINNAVEGNNHGVVEHVKSFIECLCITILTDFDKPLPSSNPMLTELLVEALRALGIHNTRGASKLDKLLSAFNKMSDVISEMRNENGPVAHGKDGFLDSIYVDHSRAFLHAGDAIVGVLLSALDGVEPNLLSTREPYERFEHLTKKIDSAVSMKSSVESDEEGYILNVKLVVSGNQEQEINLRIEPSRLLYNLDRDVFVDVLAEALAIDEVIDLGEEPEPEPEPDPESDPESAHEEALGENSDSEAEKTVEKQVNLEVYKEEFSRFVAIELGDAETTMSLCEELLELSEKYMFVDWQVIPSKQSKIKNRYRRSLLSFGVERSDASNISDKILRWFLVKIPVN